MDNLLEQFKAEHKEEIEEAQARKIIDLNNPIPNGENLPVTDNKEVADKHFLTDKTGRTSKDLVEEQRQKDFDNIKKESEFLTKSTEINIRGALEELRESENAVNSKEIDNDYVQYENKKRKELLDYRIKYEKGCVKEQAKAERDALKRANAEKRYGYLYETDEIEIIENGQKVKKLIYKNFTPSKFINRFKEFANWYENLADGFKNVIKTTGKILLIICIIAAVIGGGYGLIKWLLNNGLTI